MADTSPTTGETLERRLRTARRINVALGAAVVFLLIVVFAIRSSDDSGQRLSAAGRSDTSDESVDAPDSADGATNEAGGAGVDRSFAPDDHALVIGDPDAPVVLNEWIDMRCPFCALFNNDTMPILIEEYVDTGQMRIEIHPVSFFGEQSTAGAVALIAAADQDRFVEYLDVLYDAAPDKGHPDHTDEVLIGFAREAGVPDLDAFTAALDDRSRSEAVHRATNEAQRIGVQAVPFFVVGDQAISGAQPIDTFRSLLDQSLEGADIAAEDADS